MHYYINKDTIFRACDTYSISWHCGNSWGNGNLLGYEVCQSMGASDKDFLANEEMTLRQVAEDFKYYGITPSRNTVFLHRALSSTSCPHRSWDLHVGRGAQDTTANRNKLVDYFVSRIKHYMGGGATPAPKPQPKPQPQPDGFNINNYHTSKPNQIVLVRDDWAYKEASLTNKAEKTPKGTVLTVVDLVYSGKYPRYKLKSGLFISTRKDIVSPFESKPSTSTGGTKGVIKVGSRVTVTNPVSYDGVRLSVSGVYDVMELNGNRAVIGRGGRVTTAINVNNLALVGGGGSSPAPKPQPAKPTIKVGSRVTVTNPVSYDGVRLGVSGVYDVMELNGNRAVIGRGGQVTTAINVNNLALA